MKPVTDPAILAQLNAASGAEVTDPAILAQLNGTQSPGPQPTVIDRIVGSPVGRLIHDAVVQPLAGAADLMTKAQLMGSGIPADKITPGSNIVEQPYQAALAANRNTPGYAAARAQADKVAVAKGSGLSDQLLAPYMPAIAGTVGGLFGGSLDAANASADAQTAAQNVYATQHPIASTAAQLAGGFMAGPEMAKLPASVPTPAKQVAPSIADLKAAARASYNAVDNSGVQVSNDAMNRLGNSLQDSFGPRLDPTLHPDATAAYNRLTQYAADGKLGDRGATFSELDNLRRIVADAASSTKPADKALARMMKDRVDDFVDALKPSDLDTTLQDQLRAELLQATSAKGQIAKQIKTIEQTKPGALAARGAAGAQTRAAYMDLQNRLPEAEAARGAAKNAFQTESDRINAGPQATVDALNHAREMWARASAAETIQKQIDKASVQASANYSQSGFENALRQRFKSLALNDHAMARLPQNVQDAVRAVAKGSPTANVLRAIGKYAPHGPVATLSGMGIGSMLGGVGGAAEGGLASLAIPLTGELARAGATRMTLGAANQARDIAALGRNTTIMSAPRPFQAPAITAQSRIPYGLFGSMGMLQAQHQ